MVPRARGDAVLSVRVTQGTVLSDLYQNGSLKLVFPRPTGKALHSVLVNTAGGVTGGDRFTLKATVGPQARLTLTTQTAERAYRSAPCQSAHIRNRVSVAAGGRMNWLPQETILYDGCSLNRALEIDLQTGASVLVAEPVIFGRAAMGETLTNARFRDRIEIRIDGRPLYLDRMNLTGNVADTLSRPGVAAGARAMATVLIASADAETALPIIREIVPRSAGASLIRDGLLAARIMAADGYALRQTITPLLTRLSGEELPRPWMI